MCLCYVRFILRQLINSLKSNYLKHVYFFNLFTHYFVSG